MKNTNDNGNTNTDAADVVLILWRHRTWIITFTVIASLLGAVYSLLKSPSYQSETIISPKERDQGGMGVLARFGAQIPGLQNSVLAKYEIILKSRDLASKVIETHDLLPRLYPEFWDTVASNWKAESIEEVPTLRQAAEALRNKLVVVPSAKNGTILIVMSAGDSTFAKELLDIYLLELNNRIRQEVMGSANADREYLETQAALVTDPIFREKIQSLISYQIERAMLVSSQAFEVLESPVVPIMRSAPKRKRIVILSFLTGALFSVGSIFLGRYLIRTKLSLQERIRTR